MDPQLVAFVEVAEQRSFTRAAERLHTSQPAVSQLIRNLEDRFGVKLLDRSNRYVRLNQAGEVVYHHAKEILWLHAQMTRLVDDLANQARGPLGIGASLTFGEYVLPPLMAAFRQRYPGIIPTVSIGNTSEVVARVESGHLDIGVIEGSTSLDGVRVEALAKDIMVLVVSQRHPLAKEARVSAEDLAEELWVVREPGSGTREMTERAWLQLGIKPASAMEFGSTQAIKEFVGASLGITLLSQWAVSKELRSKSLKKLTGPLGPLERHFSIVTRESAFEPKPTRLMRAFLLEHARAITA